MENQNFFEIATEHGMKCGEFAATLKGNRDDARNALTFHRCAIEFMRHLPLNDIPLERKIQAQFELAAKMAYEGVTAGECSPLKREDVA